MRTAHLYFFKADEVECVVLKDTFITYERVSGQKINYDKSLVAFSRNVSMDCQVFYATLLQVTRVDKHERYLGLLMDISYSKVDAFGFLLEKAKKRLQGWREKT